MTTERVRTQVRDGIATITLAAPERLNAVDADMVEDLHAAITAYATDPGVRVLALTGEGRGFCAGADVSVGGAADSGVDTTTLYAAGRVTRAVLRCPKPVVACVNGVAAGVGLSFALAADHVVAAESASFMLAFTRIGLMPDGGATALVTAAVGRARALRLALTAERLPAVKAAEWGLIAECVPDAQFQPRCAAVLTGYAAGAPLAIARTKAAINAASLDLDAALAREEAGQEVLLGTADFREGVRAFHAKEPPRFTGA